MLKKLKNVEKIETFKKNVRMVVKCQKKNVEECLVCWLVDWLVGSIVAWVVVVGGQVNNTGYTGFKSWKMSKKLKNNYI